MSKPWLNGWMYGQFKFNLVATLIEHFSLEEWRYTKISLQLINIKYLANMICSSVGNNSMFKFVQYVIII